MRFDDRRVMTKIASLYYFDGWTQAKIAKKYGVSRPVISKALQRAKDEGIVEIYIKDESVHTVKLEQELEQRYGLKEVIVVSTENLSEEMIMRSLGKAMASYVNSIVKNEMKIGVSWGKTLASFVEEFPFERKESIHVIPLIGGMGRNKVEVHANQLANRLAHKLGGTCTYLYAPAIVGSKDLKDRLIDSEDLVEVLEEGRNVDVAFVGIGNPYIDSTMTDIGYLEEEDIAEIKASGVVGDINSQFFDSSGTTTHLSINDRVIGVGLTDLKNIEEVICIGHGTHKVESIHLAASFNFIDVLITDERTAKQLTKLKDF
ncbi:sugar-binding transcriptional regulator [Virgibacillus sp. W0430]|uniref:sugar-binding transcriptional regulator n=1 Tax=Virgibacillus sp. W0430 TaxID=3391580 RepID=UPI003F4454BC